VYRALARLQSYGAPPYVVYTTDEDGARSRIAFRASDSMMNEAAYPVRGSLPPARIYRAFVGPLSYSIQQAIATPEPSATTAPETDLGSALRTIVAVSSHGHIYDVKLDGDETIDGRSVYHVSLRPQRDPMHNALRELWIDRSTYDIRRARYVERPDIALFAGTAELTVDFQTVGRYRIAADWIVVYHSPDLRRPIYRVLRLLNMIFPASLPDWLFDQKAYEARRRAGDPDYLSSIFPNDLSWSPRARAACRDLFTCGVGAGLGE
jgi:hypothetical protein